MLTFIKNLLAGSKRYSENLNDQETKKRQSYANTKPGNKITDLQRGNEYLANGDFANAAACYRQAISQYPDFADAYINLGFVLKEQALYGQAEATLDQAILLAPQSADAQYLLGFAAHEQGNLDKAIQHYQVALAIKPDFEEVYLSLLNALFDCGKIDALKAKIEKALALFPLTPEFHFFAGNMHYLSEKYNRAIECYQRAIQLRPDFYDAFNNLGKVFLHIGNSKYAFRAYEMALTINPKSIEAESSLLFLRTNHFQPHPDSYLTEAKHFGEKVTQMAIPYTEWSEDISDPDFVPLRIGFVSGDFHQHPVAYFLESILCEIDPKNIQLISFPSSSLEDELTTRLKTYFSEWNPIVGLSDEIAAQKIHAHKIHILIDLAGHTTHNRLPLFAWKPAPIQVSWLGYFSSTGVAEIDYVLADPVSVPESQRKNFTEEVWYLPDTRLCFTVPSSDEKLIPTPPPAVMQGYITFGCFQRLTKITDHVLKLWGRIFQALPQAKLRLQNNEMHSTAVREEILQRLAQVGINADRVMLEGAVPRKEYLQAHAGIDIILDTFPYTGGTTTCEALWMGVPTLTLAGDSMLSRQGASLLSCCGLTDWVVEDEEAYVARAIAHASDLEKLTQLRATLRPKVLASPLFDAPRFARNFEHALIAMWRLRTSQNNA